MLGGGVRETAEGLPFARKVGNLTGEVWEYGY